MILWTLKKRYPLDKKCDIVEVFFNYKVYSLAMTHAEQLF